MKKVTDIYLTNNSYFELFVGNKEVCPDILYRIVRKNTNGCLLTFTLFKFLLSVSMSVSDLKQSVCFIFLTNYSSPANNSQHNPNI